MNTHFVAAFLACFLVSALLTWTIVGLSKKFAVFSPVSDQRWHRSPKPFLGGIAIFISFAACYLLLVDLTRMNLAILGAAAGMFFLGLFDDLRDLKPYIKFIFQIAIASFIVHMGVMVSFISNPLLATVVTVVWIVGITNAFNLLDNMDGLSGGIAAISMLSFFMIDVIRGDAVMALPALLFIGAVAGFLVFNFPPAKIFMGDSGALTIGFLLAVYSVIGTWHQASNLFLLLVTPALLLGVPIFDTALVSIQRVLHGKPIYIGGKDHSSHRLVALGWSETQAVLTLYAVALVLGSMAVFGFALNIFLAIQFSLLLLVGMVILGAFVSDVKVYSEEDGTLSNDSRNFAVIFPYVPHKRRILEICVDAILIVVAYFSAHLLRFDLKIDVYTWKVIQQSLPIIVPIKLLAMLFGGMYSGFWKYVDFENAKRIVFSLATASLAAISVLVGFYRFTGFSRSVFIIDFFLLVCLTIGFRVMLRSLRESLYGYKKEGRRLLIIGAGEAGQNFLDELRKNKGSNLRPVGIIDDDPWKKGRKVFGVTVLGDRSRIANIVEQQRVEEIIFAIPSLGSDVQKSIIEQCEQTGVPTRVI